jgi:dimeric dUTPase (all-alpha-NTP-PPase superfamily)
MTSKDIKLIKEMLQMQEKLDEAIMKEYELTEITREQLEMAILDEVGELTHELKGEWCWWKKTQAPVDDNKVLGELVDIWHFVLSYTYNYSDVRFTHIDWIVGKGINTCKQEGLACSLANIINAQYMDKLFYLIAVSLCLGFSIEDVYKAYCEKNKVNYQRLKEGY